MFWLAPRIEMVASSFLFLLVEGVMTAPAAASPDDEATWNTMFRGGSWL